jgi:hypothetical protein
MVVRVFVGRYSNFATNIYTPGRNAIFKTKFLNKRNQIPSITQAGFVCHFF